MGTRHEVAGTPCSIGILGSLKRLKLPCLLTSQTLEQVKLYEDCVSISDLLAIVSLYSLYILFSLTISVASCWFGHDVVGFMMKIGFQMRPVYTNSRWFCQTSMTAPANQSSLSGSPAYMCIIYIYMYVHMNICISVYLCMYMYMYACIQYIIL